MKTIISNILRPAIVFILLLTIAATGVVVYAQDNSNKNNSQEIDGIVEYVVQKGDTLYGIGRKFGVSVNDICKANNFSKESVLKAGQKIIIPLTNNEKAPEEKKSTSTNESSAKKKTSTNDSKNSERKYDTYTVQKGDTFWHIAKINDMTVDELKKLNKLTAESTLKAGQKLKIPASVADAKVELPDLSSSDPRKYIEKKVDPNLVWPVKNPSVTYTTGKVSGVQLSAAKKEPVTVIRAGTVMFTGNYRGFGQVVFVQSKTGLIYAYGGLGTVKAQKGQYVVFGDTVGTAGKDSIKDSYLITLMVFQKGAPIDPAKAPRG